MKAEFLAENLTPHISLLVKTLSSHAPLPILSNFLIQADSRGITFSSTDLEMGVTVTIPGKIDEEGGITVPGRQFAEVLNSLPKGKITLSQDRDQLFVTTSTSKIAFQTIAKEEFPSIFSEKGQMLHTFSQKDFHDIFSKLIFVVSTDESRPALTGICLKQKEDGIDVAATDGFRLSRIHIPDLHLFTDMENLIISSRIVSEMLSLKGTSDTVSLYYYQEGNQVIFESGEVVVVGRSIEGEYPVYERVIPTSHTTRVDIDPSTFTQNIRLSSVFARDSANIVKLSLKNNAITLFAKTSGVGEGEIKEDVVLEGDENEISFNVKYLLDFIRSADGKMVSMEMTNPEQPALFHVENNPQFIHVIMPIRVQE